MKTILWILVVASVTACAPQSRFPTIDNKLAEVEARKQRVEAVKARLRTDTRLYVVSHAIMASNVRFCGEKVQKRIGFAYQIRENFPGEWQEPAKLLGIGERLTVVGVAKGSPADVAGLMKGDRVIGLADEDIGNGKQAAANFDRIWRQLDGSEVALLAERGGEKRNMTVRPVAACDYPVRLLPDNAVNAYADGNGIHITAGMVRFAKTDTELALVIGHELAHNTRGHIQAKMGNRLLGALLGAGLSVALGVNVTNLGADIGGLAFSQEFEAEADYVGVYHTARAGYDVASAASFWRRLGVEHPKAINLQGSTHPSTAKRFLAVETAVKEFQMKKAKGLPLIPEEKDPLKQDVDTTTSN